MGTQVVDISRTIRGVRHAPDCDRFGELHIEYVKVAAGYRIVRYCRCKAFRAPDRKIHPRLATAERIVKEAPDSFLSVIPSNRVKKPTPPVPTTLDDLVTLEEARAATRAPAQLSAAAMTSVSLAERPSPFPIFAPGSVQQSPEPAPASWWRRIFSFGRSGHGRR